MEAALGTLSSLAFSGSGGLVSVSPPAGVVCVGPLFLRGSAVPYLLESDAAFIHVLACSSQIGRWRP